MNKRRTFLGLFTAAFASPILTAHAGRISFEKASGTDLLLVRRLLELVPDNPSSRRIGRALLDRQTRGFDPDRVFKNLFADIAPQEAVSRIHLQRHLDTLYRQDFASGNTVTAAGWILARSEADAIALATAYRLS